MPRAFLAIRPPDEVLDAVADAVAAARHAIVGPRWLGPEQWHLTLQFLGDARDLDAVVAAVSAMTDRVPAFPAAMGGAGAFPSPGRARILWVGVRDGVEESTALATATAQALAPLGYGTEARPWRPHMTVARLRVPAPVHPGVDALGQALGDRAPGWTVRDVVLYESQLGRAGARYTPLARFPLVDA